MNVILSPEVSSAMSAGRPVVALESTIIAHGMAYPANVETAMAVEQVVRARGAVPATIVSRDGIAFTGRVWVAQNVLRAMILSFG
jgi:pseudouridine-5'-phosphate glycosidase